MFELPGKTNDLLFRHGFVIESVVAVQVNPDSKEKLYCFNCVRIPNRPSNDDLFEATLDYQEYL